MKDANEVRLTGTVDRIRPVSTKTGAAMAEIILRVRRDRFRITALGNVAEHLLVACGPDDRLTVTGTLAASSWKDEATGDWRNSFAVTAWAVEVHGDKVAYRRREKAVPTGNSARLKPGEFQAQPGDPF